MEYYTYDKDGNYAGVTETKPSNNLWTEIAYVDSFVAPKWDGVKWIESSEWNVEVYAKEVNEKHNALFAEMYRSKNYLSIGEIFMWGNDEEYGSEAQGLIDWWRSSCKLVETHIEDADEKSTADLFIQSLPES